ncbi:MAG: glycosyltransferase, partial [Oscillospiraceae bacterium]|nr:glycosyltransferase [Oscillospiraceae bacterium]
MKKVSVIIPVYNVEPYLRQCLDSVVRQTHTNLEILLINDGSTDNSGIICDEYARRDGRVKVFHKEQNGGLSSALNIGLESFTGDFVGFVDSDDWIEPDMYKVLHDSLKGEESADISAVSYFKEYESGQVGIINEGVIPQGVLSTRDMVLYALKRDDYAGFTSYVWNKLYSADLIR